MKWMIASDIHGSAHWCGRMLERFDREGAERLVLLGDLLYHGPRNPLPEGYAPMEVAALLNARRDRILAVRGNCDAEIDQMVLEWPMMQDSLLLVVEGQTVFATHGHVFDETKPPKLHKGDILLNGHTHLQVCEQCGDFIHMNPGSVSIPKGDSTNGYMTWENGEFLWKDMDGNILKTWRQEK